MSVSDTLQRATELWQRAMELQMAGALDEAIELYLESISLHPTAEAHTYLGWTYSYQGRILEAVAECKRAIAVDPTFGNPYNDIGSYLMKEGHFDEAIPWLQKAMRAERYECYFYPHANMGLILEQRGKWLEAIAEHRKALSYRPDYEVSLGAVRRLEALMN